MSKTVFGPGVVVTSDWLNGSQQLYFDGQVDLNWHYNPLTVLDVQRTNPSSTGFNDQYVTTQTSQTSAGGQPIIGQKEFTGHISLGTDNVLSATTTYSASPKAKYTSTDAYIAQISADADGDYLVVNYGLLRNQIEDVTIWDLLTGCTAVDPNAPVADDDGTIIAYSYALGDWTCRSYIDGGTF